MEYRLAKLEDLPQLAQLRWALWLEDGEAPRPARATSISRIFQRLAGAQVSF